MNGLLLAWVRASARRPLRAVTTVLVLAVLTVATGASLVAGDDLARLFRDDARAEWGDVDVEARSVAGPFLEDGAARTLTAQAGRAVRAGAPRLELRAVATGPDGRREPQALVLGVGEEEQERAPLRALDGAASLSGLPPDAALVNARLAERLGLAAGDRLGLVVGVPQWDEPVPGRDTGLRHPALALRLEVVVAGVVADSGVADLHRTANVLLRRDVLQQEADLAGARSSVLHLDVAGEGREAAEDVVDALAPVAQRLGLALAPVQADALDVAEEEGGLFRSILLTLAAVVVLAAVAAVVELMTALGLERAGELAVLRAAGLPDRAARRLLVAEGLLYGAVGVGVGLVLAVPAGALLARVLSAHFRGLEDGRGREQVALVPDASPAALLTGALVVLLATALASRAAASRVLAAPLDDVLRGAAPPERPPAGSPTRPVAVLVAGAFLLGAGAGGGAGSGALLFLGATLVLCAAWLRARRRSPDLTATDARAAGTALLWALAGGALLGGLEDGVQAGFGALVVGGVLAVAAASRLLVLRLRALGGALAALGGGPLARTAVLVGAARAGAAPDRSALRAVTVGGALFTAAALTVLGNAQALPLERQSGGFDAVGTAVVGVDLARTAARVPGSSAVGLPHAVLPQTAYGVQRDDGPVREVVYPVRLAAVTTELVGGQRFGLADAQPRYRTAADALTAVLRDEDKAVVDRYALPEGARVGDDVVLDAPGGERRFELVAVLDTHLLGAVLVGGRPFDDLAARSGATLLLARGPQPPAELAAAWNAAARDTGLDLRPLAEVRDQVVRANRTFTDVFAVLLLLGVVVVVASLGAGVLRTARERRAESAVLRALGGRRRDAVLALAVEPLLPTAAGAVAGLAVGLLVLRLLFALGGAGLAFVLDVPRLLALVVLVLLTCAATVLAAALVATRRDVETDLQDLG